jgi:heavy metal translocating P-type ATPase
MESRTLKVFVTPPRTVRLTMTLDFAGRTQALIAVLALLAISLHIVLRWATWPLWVALVLGGGPLVWNLLKKVARRQFGSDLLAGISIVTSIWLGEYLAGTLVVLMLSGGEALEQYAVTNASSALDALARRMPTQAHRTSDGHMTDVPLDDVQIGDTLVVMPHETCPVDGVVVAGHGSMDESYLTGEPYVMSKTPGVAVLSGAINGPSALTIRAEQRAVDSRYAKIMQVMRESEARRPQLQRLGDQLGAIYTPVAAAIAAAAWAWSGDPVRFLAVLVIATPCPLLIAIPVAVIGSISLAARRGIIVKDPAALERLSTCRVVIFDKTGTLTYGHPQLTETIPAHGHSADLALQLVASLEVYSKHPLASAILEAARAAHLVPIEASEVHERPGEGLTGVVGDRAVVVTSRSLLARRQPDLLADLPAHVGGMECIVLIDGQHAATMRFRDEPREDSATFIQHLGPRHRLARALLVSGDRESEVQYLSRRVGITEIHASQTPEQKVALVRQASAAAPTLFLGDGINDAPALHAADVGLSVDTAVDIAREAADMILLGHDLAVLHDGVLEGRRTFANIMKYMLMGTSSNFGNMFSMAGAALFLPFLPMLPTQILLNNMLYDISEVPIPLDRVDDEEIRRPRVLDIDFIRNFMLLIGPISSLFDFLTFYVLLAVLHANEALFQTGWFIESLTTQVLVIFVIRSRASAWRGGAHPLLVATSCAVVAIAALLPLTPVAAYFGFVAPPPQFYAILAAMTAAYLLLVEMVKRYFYRHIGGH